MVAFAALKTPTITGCDRLCRSVHVAVISSTDGLKTLIKSVEGFRGPSANSIYHILFCYCSIKCLASLSEYGFFAR